MNNEIYNKIVKHKFNSLDCISLKRLKQLNGVNIVTTSQLYDYKDSLAIRK